MKRSDLLDASRWTRSDEARSPGCALVEQPPYSISRFDTPAGRKYLLWFTESRNHNLLGAHDSADLARAAAASHFDRVTR